MGSRGGVSGGTIARWDAGGPRGGCVPSLRRRRRLCCEWQRLWWVTCVPSHLCAFYSPVCARPWPSCPTRSGMNAFVELKRNPALKGGWWVAGGLAACVRACALGRRRRLAPTLAARCWTAAAQAHAPCAAQASPPCSAQPDPYPNPVSSRRRRLCLLSGAARGARQRRRVLGREAEPRAGPLAGALCHAGAPWGAGRRVVAAFTAQLNHAGPSQRALAQRCAPAATPPPAAPTRLPHLQAVNNRVVHRSNHFLKFDGGTHEFQYQEAMTAPSWLSARAIQV